MSTAVELDRSRETYGQDRVSEPAARCSRLAQRLQPSWSFKEGGVLVKGQFEETPQGLAMVGAVIACALATAVAPTASAATFSARETHRGLLIDRAGGETGRLVPNGWFRRRGDPTFVYREGGVAVAGVWDGDAGAAVVRSGTTENAPVIGRIVPAWNDDELRLTIEPAGAAAVRTTVFERASGGGTVALDRGTSTRAALQGTYRATLTSTGGGDAGWLNVDIDPEGATRFAGDLPPAIPPALAAAAAAAIEGEVDFIYGNVDDVAPLHR
jgi:hypothetical protein